MVRLERLRQVTDANGNVVFLRRTDLIVAALKAYVANPDTTKAAGRVDGVE